MKRALAEGTQDARLFYHAGVIAAARGERAEARRWLDKALAAQQMLLPSEREDLTQQLASLERQAHTPEKCSMKYLIRSLAGVLVAAMPCPGASSCAGLQPHGCAAHHP